MTAPIPAMSTKTNATIKNTTTIVTPDYIKRSAENDGDVKRNTANNPIYKAIIDSNEDRDTRINKVVDFIISGLDDINNESVDKRVNDMTQFNNFIQVMRRELGTAQAREMTSKAQADFQRILNETAGDVKKYEEQLNPLCKLAELFSVYGADGNLIEKINAAIQQKYQRESMLATTKAQHERTIYLIENEIKSLKQNIQNKKEHLAESSNGVFSKLFGGSTRLSIEAEIANTQKQLDEREIQLETAKNEVIQIPVDPNGNADEVDEEILELQNLGGPAFVKAIEELRQHTELSMAKMSSNFDEAEKGLNNTRASFVSMDRNCSDATMALTVLSAAIKRAEAIVRKKATDLVSDSEVASENTDSSLAELDKMEKERKSELLLGFTNSLTTFQTDLNVAVTSLRSGQAVIKNILQMNALALQSANTHKITGIANTADAVTITIGSIIDVCNRAASRAVADGLTRIRNRAEEGSARLTGGIGETLALQNEQMQSFVDSVINIREQTASITANSVDLLKQQFAIIGQMADESTKLADATTDAQRTQFEARAGVESAPNKPSDEPVANTGFGLKMSRS